MGAIEVNFDVPAFLLTSCAKLELPHHLCLTNTMLLCKRTYMMYDKKLEEQLPWKCSGVAPINSYPTAGLTFVLHTIQQQSV